MAAKRKHRPGPLGEAPMCNCLLLCDDVLISRGKGKHFLQGIIGTIGVAEVPATIGGYTAYVRVSNVYPKQKLSLTFENADTGEVLIQTEAGFPPSADPLGVYTLVIRVPIFVVKDEGRYLFVASHGGVPIAMSPVEIRVLPRRNEP